MLGSLTPVEHLDAKEYGRVLATQPARPQALIAAFDPMLRKAERADVIGITSSVGHEPRAFWGGYGSSKAAFDNLLGAYADETEHTRPHPGAHRRSRRNAHPHAPARLPGRGAGEREAARRSSAEFILERLCCPT